MTISIWRYSHLILALASGLFLILASVTGIILAFEPIQSASESHQTVDLSKVSVAETIGIFQERYDEVLSLKVDENDFLLAEVVTHQGESKRIFANPQTGEELGIPKPQSKLFQFTTNLHRSLFLKGVGRFFVGLVSFLLCLIAITGLILITKRQGGLFKLFSKVQRDYFEMRYHVIFGRWFLVPIIILAATGVYLSAEKFSLLPSTIVIHDTVEPEARSNFELSPSELPVFKAMQLDEVRSITFPFSEFPEDYFEVALKDRELYIHQYSGDILSDRSYPFTALASRWSMILHTGQGSIIWSIVLLFASGSILFFMYSGFIMWRKRVKSTKVQKALEDKDECSHIILVGSETGNTFKFAQVLEKALIEGGKSVFVSELNAYTTYAKAQHIIVLTATYGEGEAPTNARNFKDLVHQVTPKNQLSFSVVAFGSLLYPDYCRFGVEVDELLAAQERFDALLPLYKINNQSIGAFIDWSKSWGNETGVDLKIKPFEKEKKYPQRKPFEVVHCTEPNEDKTYLLRLKPQKKTKFQSGDLLAYTPEKEGLPRQYSIAKVQEEILLSIKRHEFGVVSKALAELEQGSIIRAAVIKNKEFHYPKYAPEIICISNGTGIAPFLGMISENVNNKPLHLYWGGRRKSSFAIYKEYVDEALNSGKLTRVNYAYSQDAEAKTYVQELLRKDKSEIAKKLNAGAVVMICGSIAMQREVLDVLEQISNVLLNKPLSEFEHQEQLKMDCY
ncbi:MAG: oxidoreductase [Allomuricauda sp.]|nr:MAG: oxidoreductase [Allomuricauda sp.]